MFGVYMSLRSKLIRLAHTNPELREHLLPLLKSADQNAPGYWYGLEPKKPGITEPALEPKQAAWENLPDGWTQESVQSMWDTMTGDVKHKITKCMEEMDGKVDDTGAFCGSLASQVGYKKAALRVAEWKGWTENMPVQVVGDGHTEVFENLADARKKYPKLDPVHGGGGFHWAMRGEVKGKPAIRFESHGAYQSMSRDASLLRTAIIRVAHENPNLRTTLLPCITRRA